LLILFTLSSLIARQLKLKLIYEIAMSHPGKGNQRTWLYHMTLLKTIKSTYEIAMPHPGKGNQRTWLYHMTIKKQ
jgi:hypothetical protein